MVLPFKDQKYCQESAQGSCLERVNYAARVYEFAELIKNIRTYYLVEETKPQIVNQQYVVYSFKCDLCNAGLCGLYARTLTPRTCRKTQTTVILDTQTL